MAWISLFGKRSRPERQPEQEGNLPVLSVVRRTGQGPSVSPLLEAQGVTVRVRASGEKLLSDVSLTLHSGRCLGIAGESGSGKTLLCRALLGLLPPSLSAEGRAFFNGIDMLTAGPEALRQQRGTGLGLVLQQMMQAFDPLRSMEAHFLETLREKCGLAPDEARRKAEVCLERMGLERDVLRAWPHQLSGGMLQRCMIALTLSLEPVVIVADEPTTALDARHQFQMVELLAGLRQEQAMIIVSHDLAVMQALADDLLIMHNGQCVESGPAATVLTAPGHACTRQLLEMRRALSRPFLHQKSLSGLKHLRENYQHDTAVS